MSRFTIQIAPNVGNFIILMMFLVAPLFLRPPVPFYVSVQVKTFLGNYQVLGEIHFVILKVESCFGKIYKNVLTLRLICLLGGKLEFNKIL